VSALPEVCVLPRSLASPAFLILATDGLWSVCSSAEAAKFVTNQVCAAQGHA
jgi:serine/threonine protein phosphatase PrpC